MSRYGARNPHELLGECVQTVKELQGRVQALIDRFSSEPTQLDRLKMVLARLQARVPSPALDTSDSPDRGNKLQSSRSSSPRPRRGRKPRGPAQAA
jgi:hypothetical protein